MFSWAVCGLKERCAAWEFYHEGRKRLLRVAGVFVARDHAAYKIDRPQHGHGKNRKENDNGKSDDLDGHAFHVFLLRSTVAFMSRWFCGSHR